MLFSRASKFLARRVRPGDRLMSTTAVGDRLKSTSAAAVDAAEEPEPHSQPILLTRNPSLNNMTEAAPVADGSDWLVGERPERWWTGKAPVHGLCPGVAADGTMSSLPLVRTDAGRDGMQDYFDNTWTLTEVLFSALQGDQAFVRIPYHRLRHPMLFYYGHVACLYVNKMRVAQVLDGPVDAYFEELFETGVDEMSWDDVPGVRTDWPSVEEVRKYRKAVYDAVSGVIAEHPGLAPSAGAFGDEHPLWSLIMGFEHERIHLETSSVLLRELPLSLLRRPEQWPADAPSGYPEADAPLAGEHFPAPRSLEVGAKTVTLGKPRDHGTFGWDNEYGHEEHAVAPFEAGERLVTNGEFHAFVKAGGYHEQRWWSESGWGWKRFRNVKWPTFWISDGPQGLHQYRLRTVFDSRPMPWAAPAEVNYHEAKAYCAWLNAQQQEKGGEPWRLLTENEHHALRSGAEAGGQFASGLSGHDCVATETANLQLGYSSCTDVDAMRPTEAGFHDVFGNAWQWTEDWFRPLAHSEQDGGGGPHAYYPDFSEPCYDNEHKIILGGSWASTGDEATEFARFHFREHYYQHAGFRCARAASGRKAEEAAPATHGGGAAAAAEGHGAASVFAGGDYEDVSLLHQYLALHFDQHENELGAGSGLPAQALQFPQRCARVLMQAHAAEQQRRRGGGAPARWPARALDLGCAVGGSSFELSLLFDEVVGIDFSGSFVEAAQSLQRGEALEYERALEGTLKERKSVVLPRVPNFDRVAFHEGDACNLPADIGRFDAVLMANLLCRLPDPVGCIEGVEASLNPGGVMMVASPYSWMSQYTPVDKWIGGSADGGSVERSAAQFVDLMQGRFGMTLVNEFDMPLLIPEHARKYQYILSHTTVWRKEA